MEQKLRFVDQLRPPLVDELVLTGGEALLAEGIYEIIARAKGNGLKVGVLTNGILLTEENCKKLTDLKVDVVSVSVDSLDPKMNNQLRRNTGDATRGVKNLMAVKPQSMGVEIMMTVTRINTQSIRPMVDLCVEQGINLWLDPVEINPGVSRIAHLDLTKMNAEEIEALQADFEYWSKNMRNPTLKAYSEACIEILKGGTPTNINCEMGTNQFVVDVDGSMYPCFSRKDINYGNVYQKRLSEVLDNPLIPKKYTDLQAAGCVTLGCVCMTIVSDYTTNNNK